MVDDSAELETAWNRAKNGETLDGSVTHGDAYIAYETAEMQGERHFKMWVGLETEALGGTSARPVRDAISMALTVVPEADFGLESGEMYALVEL